MNRTKLFVSYSHRDRAWLERLKVHLALLQRRKIVHVWSDTRIEVGARWLDEIEAALTECRAAVLMITPDYLASDFIWDNEMPRILDHQKAGMEVLPLIVRPCAWRIAPELAELQARPMDGRPLSLGTEADVDRDLAEFVYEIAGRLEQLSATVASEQLDVARSRMRASSTTPADASGRAAPSSPAAEESGSIEVGQAWVGIYHPTARQFRLVIQERTGRRFSGTVQYLDDGSVTNAEGECIPVWESFADFRTAKALIAAIGTTKALAGAVDLAVTFQETAISNRGAHPPELGGEYLAVVSGDGMTGVWQSKGKTRGHFDLKLEK